MKRIFLLILICFESVLNLNAQSNKLDSLHSVLLHATDTARINTLIIIARHHFHGDPDSSLTYIEKALELATDIDYRKGLKEVNICFSIYQFLKNNFDKSISIAEKVFLIKGPDYTVEFDADAYTLIANAYLRKSMYDKALRYDHLALAIYENKKISRKQAMILNNIGAIFYEQERFKEAIKYYSKSIEIRTLLGAEKELITPYSNLGNCYNSINDNKKALECQQKALDISLKTNTPYNIATCYQDIGAIYYSEDNFSKALEYKVKALNIFRNSDYLVEITSCYLSISGIYGELKDFKTALLYNDSARVIADSTNFTFNRKTAYKSLSDIYKTMGNYKEALKYYEISNALKDSLLNEENNKTITEIQTKYESEKKDIEILVQKTEIDKQHTQRNAFIIGTCLLLLLLIFILRSFYQKKKDNRIITAQKKEVEHQKALVEENRKELIDSIHYAKRIQTALLPSDKYILKNIEKLKKS